jgi:type II secretory pathway component PulK
VIDSMIIRNRDNAARAESLARGGIRIATGVLMHDAFATQDLANEEDSPGATYRNLWARMRKVPLSTPDGGGLRVAIEDAQSKLNLNALVPLTGSLEESAADQEAEEYLIELLDKVIDEMPIPPGEKFYDTRELAQSLLDYIDLNEDSELHGFEDDWYQQQDPPYWPANGPLMSLDELSLIRGFDSKLVAALRPYVTVHPIGSREGINLNTAPAHVLAAVYYGDSSDMRLADEDIVRQLLRLREEDQLVCTESGMDPKRCVGLVDVGLGEGSIYPPVSLPAKSAVYTVTAEATVGDVRRRIEAVIDRSGDEKGPVLLSWRVR